MRRPTEVSSSIEGASSGGRIGLRRDLQFTCRVADGTLQLRERDGTWLVAGQCRLPGGGRLLAGRLELYAILVLLLPLTWKK